MNVRSLTMAVVLAMILAACGGGDDAADTNGDGGGATMVAVTAVDIDFQPDRIEVPAGETITVEVTNDGATEHDFHVEEGTETGMIQPGDSASVDIGPFEEDTVAWCTVPGHREAGMEVEIAVQ